MAMKTITCPAWWGEGRTHHNNDDDSNSDRNYKYGNIDSADNENSSDSSNDCNDCDHTDMMIVTL